MSTLCNRTGCELKAKFRVGARLWAKGYPKSSPPAEMSSGLVVCDHHKAEPGPIGEFFTREMREVLELNFASRGKVPPDFDGAEWVFTRLED